MTDNTPFYVAMFDMTVSLCDRFPAFTPLAIRKERFHEVINLIVRFKRWGRRNTKNGKQIIRRPAGDNWF